MRGRGIPGLLLCLVYICLCQLCLLGSADAQVTYNYHSQNFNTFSCGPSGSQYGGVIDCSNPGPGQTTYSTGDYVFAWLTLSQALPPNLNMQDVHTLPGFQLTMSDGQQTLTSAAPNMSVVAEVSTDANGNVVAPWWIQVYAISSLDNGITSVNSPSNGVEDLGDTSLTQTGGDLGAIFGNSGAWFLTRSGTAAWFYLSGSSFGIPFGTYSGINGGDGQPYTNQFSMVTPGGWTWAQSRIGGPHQLSAGAYGASSGPCLGDFSGCDDTFAAARGLAYETFNNTGGAITAVLNASLEGGFINSSGGEASAAIYVVDATDFANSVPTGTAAAQYLLANSSIQDFTSSNSSALDLSPLFHQVLATSTTAEPVTAGAAVSVPVVTKQFQIGAGQNVTVIFDVTAYAPPGTIGGGPSTVDFSHTLAPAANLFTDQNGNPITQLVPVGPAPYTPPVPAMLTLTPASASAQVGAPALVTVTARDSNGTPVPNATVQFAIVSGPNSSPLTGPVATNASGQATFSDAGYGGAGTDSIKATAGSVTSNTATVTWTTPGPLDHIVISPTSASILAGGSQSYTAQAYDKLNDLIGDVTGAATFSISPDGSCIGATCTAATPGLHIVTATYNGDTAQSSLTVNSNQTTPVITWPIPAAITYGTALGAGQLDASATVAGTFTYSPSAGAVLGAGNQTLSVTFTPTDSTDYTTATAQVTLVVNMATPQITWSTPTSIAYGTALSAAQLNAAANTPGTFIYAPAAGTVLAPGNQPLSVSFTPTDATDYTTASAGVTLNVTMASQTITFTGLPASATYGSAGPYTLVAMASSSLPVSYSIAGPASITGTTLTITGAGTVTVTASQAGNANYSAAAPVTLNIIVNKAGQTITFNAIPTQTVGTPLTLAATASSSLAVSYASTTSSICTVSGSVVSMLAPGTCSIVASQVGNANFAAATSVTQSFSVQAATPASFTITPLPGSETISRGVLAAFVLELNSVKGFSGNVSLSCSGGPSKSICVNLPQTVKLNGVALAISGILFPANSTPGTYTITFTGVSGTSTASTTAKFTVK